MKTKFTPFSPPVDPRYPEANKVFQLAAGEAAHTLKTYQQPDWKGWYTLTRVTVVEVYGIPPTTASEANAVLSRAENRGVDSFTTQTAGDGHAIAEFPRRATK